MAVTQDGDVEVEVSANASQLVAELRRGQDAIDNMRDAGARAGKGVAKGMDEATAAAKRAAAEQARAARAAERETVAAAKRAAAEQVAAAKKAANEIKAQEAAAAAAARRISSGGANLANQVSDVVTQLSSGTSPLTVLIQQGPQAAGAISQMGVSLATVAAVGGPAIAIIGALAAAYIALTRETRREAEARAFSHDIALSFVAVERQITAEKIAQDVATGKLTKAQGEEATAREAARQAMLDYATAQVEVRTGLEAQIDLSSTWRGEMVKLQHGIAATAAAAVALAKAASHPLTDTFMADFKAAANETNRYLDAVTGLESGVAEAKRKLAELDAAELTQLDHIKQLRDATIATSRAREEGKAAANEAADAEKALTAAFEAMAAAHERYIGDIERIRAVEDVWTEHSLTGIALVEQKREEALAKVAKDLADAQRDAKAANTSATDAEQAAADARVAIEDGATAQIAEIQERARKEKEKADAAAAKKAAAERKREVEAIANSIVGGLGMVKDYAEKAEKSHLDYAERLQEQLNASGEWLTKSQRDALEKRIEDQRQAARKAFTVEKLAAMAEASVNTALAVSQALASAPPPFNIPVAVAAGIAGAAQEAAIAAQAPSFHRGGVEGSARRDERMATVLDGEAWLSRQGRRAMGDDAIHAANAGKAPTPGAVVPLIIYDGRVMDRVMTDRLRQGGRFASQIAAARATPYGIRSRNVA